MPTKYEENEEVQMFPDEWLNTISEIVSPLDNHCIQKLNELAKKNTLADNGADEVIKILKQIKNEYIAANTESQHTLAKLQLLPIQLHKCTQGVLQKAVEVETMELNPCIFGQDVEKTLQAADEIKFKRLIVTIRKANVKLQTLNEKMKAALMLAVKETQKLQESLDKNDAQLFSNYFERKEAEYIKKLAIMMNELSKAGITDIGLFNTLRKTHTEVMLKEKQIAHLNLELKEYGDLPPNLLAATEVLAKLTEEYDELNRKLKKKITDDYKSNTKM